MVGYDSTINNNYIQYCFFLNCNYAKVTRFMFCNGLVFLVTGLLLIIYWLITINQQNTSINWICGLVFSIFGIFMIVAAGKKM